MHGSCRRRDAEKRDVGPVRFEKSCKPRYVDGDLSGLNPYTRISTRDHPTIGLRLSLGRIQNLVEHAPLILLTERFFKWLGLVKRDSSMPGISHGNSR